MRGGGTRALEEEGEGSGLSRSASFDMVGRWERRLAAGRVSRQGRVLGFVRS